MSSYCFQEEKLEEEETGFKCALFFLNSEIDKSFSTPKKEILKNEINLDLSLETKSVNSECEEHNKNEISANFCIGRDLMRKLNESSPAYAKTFISKLSSNKSIGRVGEIQSKEAKDRNPVEENEITNKQIEKLMNSRLNNQEHHKEGSPSTNYASEEIPRFDFSFDTINEPKEMNCAYTNYQFNNANYSTMNLNEQNYFLNPMISSGNQCATGLNMFSQNFYLNSFSNYNSLNASRQLNYQNFQKAYQTNHNVETFMYGKQGWICYICKNFNYDSKFKFKYSSSKM
jgi:hypothetical protein